jgi:hypothetical protein
VLWTEARQVQCEDVGQKGSTQKEDDETLRPTQPSLGYMLDLQGAPRKLVP